MKYFPANPAMDALIEKIKKSIHLTMNGVTAERMEQGGIHYKQNFGLSIPQLKQLASKYEQNHDLAQRLWALRIRETMILGCMLQPVASFSKTLAEEWVKDCSTIELIEQACMHLFSKLPYAAEIATKWIESDNEKICICGFTVAGRIIKTLTEEELDYILKTGIEKAKNENFIVYNAIAVSLRNITRRSHYFAIKTAEAIQTLDQTHKSTQFIYQEVKTEIDFYYNK